MFQGYGTLDALAKKEELRQLRRSTPPLTSRTSPTPTGEDDTPSPALSPQPGKGCIPRPNSAASSLPDSLVRASSTDLIRKAAGGRRKTIANTLCISLKPDLTKVKDQYALYRQLTMDKAANMYESAQKAFEEERYDQCISFLRKALFIDSTNVNYYILRAETYLKLKDFTSAITNYKRVCITLPDDDEHFSRLAHIYFLYGEQLQMDENYLEALEAYSKAAEMKPDIPGYHLCSINCLSSLKRHGECMTLINKRLQVIPGSPDLLLLRAKLHLHFHNSTLCYFDVKDALANNPDHKEAAVMFEQLKRTAESYMEEATSLDMKNKTNEAILKISNAIDTNPSVTKYHVVRAGMHRRSKNFNSAVDDLLLAMDKCEQNPKHPLFVEAQVQLLLTFNDFAVDCFQKGFYEEAIVLLDKAIKSEKNNKSLYINRGDCFLKLSYLHYALLDYQQALEIDPHNRSIYVRLSVVYNELGLLEYGDKNYRKAEEFFSSAVDHNPSSPSYYVSRARCRYMLESHESAKVDILSALHLNAKHKDAFPMFARLYPGETTTEVLSSEFGVLVKEALLAVIDDRSKEAGILMDIEPRKSLSASAVLPKIPSSQKNVTMEMNECMKEAEFHVNIIKDKKKVNELVESVIQSRQDLKSTKPKIASAELPTKNRVKKDKTRKSKSADSTTGFMRLKGEAFT